MSHSQQPASEQDNCDQIATCPPYRTLESRQQYEIRVYATHKWASTIVMNENRMLAQWEGIAKLQEYFNGHNEQGNQQINRQMFFLTKTNMSFSFIPLFIYIFIYFFMANAVVCLASLKGESCVPIQRTCLSDSSEVFFLGG